MTEVNTCSLDFNSLQYILLNYPESLASSSSGFYQLRKWDGERSVDHARLQT